MKKLVLIGIAGIAAALSTSLAQAATLPVVQTFKVTIKPNKPSRPAGLNIDQEASLQAGDERLQPPALQREIIRLNRGGQFNGPKFPICNAAKLESTGECPTKTKIGSGEGSATARPVVTDVVHGDLTLYNGGSKIHIWVVPDLGPNFVVTGKVSKKPSGPYDYKLDFTIPPIKTLPGAPDASVIGVHTKTPAKTIRKKGKKIGLIVSPKKCTGKWVGQNEFRYADATKQVVKSQMRCKKG